jgi:hypothetical protein
MLASPRLYLNIFFQIYGTAYINVIKDKLTEGSSEKVNKTIFENQNKVIFKAFYCFNLFAVFKQTYLIMKAKVFVAN